MIDFSFLMCIITKTRRKKWSLYPISELTSSLRKICQYKTGRARENTATCITYDPCCFWMFTFCSDQNYYGCSNQDQIHNKLDQVPNTFVCAAWIVRLNVHKSSWLITWWEIVIDCNVDDLRSAFDEEPPSIVVFTICSLLVNKGPSIDHCFDFFQFIFQSNEKFI